MMVIDHSIAEYDENTIVFGRTMTMARWNIEVHRLSPFHR